MEAKTNIDQLVEETLESITTIDKVNTPPFFKDKVLRNLSQQNELAREGVIQLKWFTPKLQAAALICFVFLNLAALLSNNSTESYSDNVSSFAEVYGLSETDADSYLYQN